MHKFSGRDHTLAAAQHSPYPGQRMDDRSDRTGLAEAVILADGPGRGDHTKLRMQNLRYDDRCIDHNIL